MQKSCLDQRRQPPPPKAGYHLGPSPGPSPGDILRERRTSSRFFMLTPPLSPPLKGCHAERTPCLTRCEGEQITPASGRKAGAGGAGGGKWALMENTQNRNERNPPPLLLSARSDSFFCLFFYSSTIVLHTGPRSCEANKPPELFLW